MRRIINLLLVVLLSMSIFTSVSAKDKSEMNFEEWIASMEDEGYTIEKISEQELVDYLMKKESTTYNNIIEKYDLKKSGSNSINSISDFYTFKKNHSENFSSGSFWGTTMEHRVTVKLYHEGTFREILHVYGSDLYSANPEFTLNNMNPHTPDWNGGYVSYYTSGYLKVLQSLSIGLTLFDVVSISINGIPYWQRYVSYGDTINLY